MLAAMLGAAGGVPLAGKAKVAEPPPEPTLGDLERIEKAKAKRRRKAERAQFRQPPKREQPK